jgi:hypothetical protein
VLDSFHALGDGEQVTNSGAGDFSRPGFAIVLLFSFFRRDTAIHDA